MTLFLYVSTVSGNNLIRTHQKRIEDVLQSKKIPFKLIDISADVEAKNKMQASMMSNNKKEPFLPPQLFYGDEYLGGYEEFENAIEDSCLETFLRATN
nr:sh3 domain binding glutamic acid rich [Hymenolepis microstoma]